MKYNFFANLNNIYSGTIENITPYQEFFSSVDIVPGDITLQSIGKDSFGKNVLVTCVTTKGLVLNFNLRNIYEEHEYRDYLCGVCYIYNNKFFFLRNFGFNNRLKPTCIADFFDTESLNYLKEQISGDKLVIERSDFTKYGINPDATFNVVLEDYDKKAFEVKSDDLICMISSMAFDEKVRKRS